MKRILSVILVLSIMISMNVGISAIVQLNDVQGHWAERHITYLTENSVINGYSDGTFKPQGTIKVAEFIKLNVAILGNSLDTSGYDYWATPYIEKALELGLIYEGQFNSYERPITREEMAYISVKTFSSQDTVTENDRMDEVVAAVVDYSTITSEYKNDVIECYYIGLITGMPDGSFNPKGNATRAEASVVIVRTINETERKPYVFDIIEPVTVSIDEPVDYEGNVVTGLDELVEDGTFDEETNKIQVETSVDERRMELSVRLDAFGEEGKHPYLLTFYNCVSPNELDYYETNSSELVDSIMLQIFEDNANEGRLAIEAGIHDAMTAYGGTYADRRYLAGGRQADVVLYQEEGKVVFHISNPIY